MFGGAGDTADVKSAVTGEYAGQELPLWQRLLGFLPAGGPALGAVVAGGNMAVRAARIQDATTDLYEAGTHAWWATEAARVNSRFNTNPVLEEGSGLPGYLRYLRGTPQPVSQRSRRLAGQLGVTSYSDEVLVTTQKRSTNRLLQMARNETSDPASVDEMVNEEWLHLTNGVRSIDEVDADGNVVRSWRDMTPEERTARELEFDIDWRTETLGYLVRLGTRLVDEVEEHTIGASKLTAAPQLGAQRAAAYELARFGYLMQDDTLQTVRILNPDGTRANKTRKVLGEAWQKMRAGERLSDYEWDLLENAIVQNAKITQAFTDVEYSIAPQVAMSAVNLGVIDPNQIEKGVALGKDSTVTLDLVRFPGISLDLTDEAMLNKRIQALSQLNPKWLTEQVASNKVDFFETFVLYKLGEQAKGEGKDLRQLLGEQVNLPESLLAEQLNKLDSAGVFDENWLSRGSSWYAIANDAIWNAVKDPTSPAFGYDPRKLIALTSITSASQVWETNIAKAVEIAKDLDEEARSWLATRGTLVGFTDHYHNKLLGKVWKDGEWQKTGTGITVSKDDLVRLMMVEFGIRGDETTGLVEDLWHSKKIGVVDTAAGRRAAVESGVLAEGEKPLTLKQLGEAWEQSGDIESMRSLMFRRALSSGEGALKQPSFDDAIFLALGRVDGDDVDGVGRWLDDTGAGVQRVDEDVLLERGMYMARMLAGETPGGTPGSYARRVLPYVTDRQDFKVSMGFSINPGTWLSGTTGGYDSLAEGGRIAAALLSEKYGVLITPEQLQAITWVVYREMANIEPVTGSTSIPWSLSGMSFRRANKGFRWDAETSRFVGDKAKWGSRAGGPDMVWRNNILDVLVGNNNPMDAAKPTKASAPGTRGKLKSVDYSRESQVIQDTVQVSVDPKTGDWVTSIKVKDGRRKGEFVKLKDGVTLPRGQYVSRAVNEDGERLIFRVTPMRIFGNVFDYIKNELGRTAVNRLKPDFGTETAANFGGVGGTILPRDLPPVLTQLTGARTVDEFLTGDTPAIWWSLPVTRNDGEPFNPRAAMEAQILEAQAVLGEGAIRGAVFPDAPHTGVSTPMRIKRPGEEDVLTWSQLKPEELTDDMTFIKEVDSEARQGVWLVFDSPESAQRAAEFFGQLDLTASGIRTTGVEEMNRVAAAAGNPDAGDLIPVVKTEAQLEQDRAYETWLGQLQADAYQGMPVWSGKAEVMDAYDTFSVETARQFERLGQESPGRGPNGVGGRRIKIIFQDEDPYKGGSQEMIDDVLNNGVLRVYKTKPGDHPLLSAPLNPRAFPGEGDWWVNESSHPLMMNDLFRAVHDFYGHFQAGNSFGRFGEEIAWAVHGQMYGQEAFLAMTMETRAQNRALVYSRGSRQAEVFQRLLNNQAQMVADAQRILTEYQTNAGLVNRVVDPGDVPDDYVRVFRAITVDENGVELPGNPAFRERLAESGQEWMEGNFWTIDPNYAWGHQRNNAFGEATGIPVMKEIVLPRAVYEQLDPTAPSQWVGAGPTTRFIPPELEEVFGSVRVKKDDPIHIQWYQNTIGPEREAARRSVTVTRPRTPEEMAEAQELADLYGEPPPVRDVQIEEMTGPFPPLTLRREDMVTSFQFAEQKVGIPSPIIRQQDGSVILARPQLPPRRMAGGLGDPVDQVPEMVVLLPRRPQSGSGPVGFAHARLKTFVDDENNAGWSILTESSPADRAVDVYIPDTGPSSSLHKLAAGNRSKLSAPGSRTSMVSVQDPQNLVVGQVAAFNLPTSTVAGDGVADFVSGSSTKSSGPVELSEMTVGGEAGVKIRVTRPPQGRERTPKVAVLTPDQIEVVFPPDGGVPTFRFGVSNSKEFPELALWSGKGQLPAEATATTLRLTVKSDSELVVAGGRSQAVSFELIDQVQDVLLNLGSERKVLGEAAAAMKAKKA